jgi:uncharacterized tellurite resistance protein B-like protein
MDERLARCLLIAKVLAADGIMTDAERDFLESAMEGLGLDDEQRRQVRDFEGWDEAEPIVATLALDEKRALMDGLVHAVLADGKVSPHEMETIKKLSAALGLE